MDCAINMCKAAHVKKSAMCHIPLFLTYAPCTIFIEQAILSKQLFMSKELFYIIRHFS